MRERLGKTKLKHVHRLLTAQQPTWFWAAISIPSSGRPYVQEALHFRDKAGWHHRLQHRGCITANKSCRVCYRCMGTPGRWCIICPCCWPLDLRPGRIPLQCMCTAVTYYFGTCLKHFFVLLCCFSRSCAGIHCLCSLHWGHGICNETMWQVAQWRAFQLDTRAPLVQNSQVQVVGARWLIGTM